MDIVRATRCSSIPWAFALLLTAGPAAAQGVPYKVTGPDGRVTYTDRPPADARSVRPLGGAGAAVAPEEDWLEDLPFTLRQRAQRYPVTLYTAPGCAPCDLGRLALQQRGVPFREWRVEPDGGAAELQRREGTASLPVLRVGQQQLLGFEAGEWRSTLDAAGYPAASALPPNWQPPPVAALKAPPPATTRAPEGAPAAARAPAPDTRADRPAGGFRF